MATSPEQTTKPVHDPPHVMIDRNRMRSALADIAELVGGSVDHPESVRAAVEEMDSTLNDIRVDLAQLRTDMLAVQQHLQRAHGCTEGELAAEVDRDFMRAMVDGLRGQRDEWRREVESRAPAAAIERLLLERNQFRGRLEKLRSELAALVHASGGDSDG